MILNKQVSFFNSIKYSSKSVVFNCVLNTFSTNSRIKTIKFKTCGQLFDKLKQTRPKLYANSPSDGLAFSVDYVDTFGDRRDQIGECARTILAIHGTPGHYGHFDKLVDYFHGNRAHGSNVRIIVPNMPDFGITRRTKAFWHTNEERSQFIRDFLKAINVTNIDCLISHSVGINPISLIWTNPKELTIKSIGLLSPQYLPERFYLIARTLSVFCRTDWGIELMDRYRPHVSARSILPVNFTSVDQVLCFFLVQSDIINREYYCRLAELKALEIPTLVVYGEMDRAIPKQDYQKFTRRLGADTADMTIYSDPVDSVKLAERDRWIKVLSFKSGGHFCYTKFSDNVCKHLAEHCLRI